MHNNGTQVLSEERAASLPHIEIRPLRAGEDTTAFRTLNEEWITPLLHSGSKGSRNSGRSRGQDPEAGRAYPHGLAWRSGRRLRRIDPHGRRRV